MYGTLSSFIALWLCYASVDFLNIGIPNIAAVFLLRAHIIGKTR